MADIEWLGNMAPLASRMLVGGRRDPVFASRYLGQ